MKNDVKTGGFSMDYCRFGGGERILVILPGVSVQRVLGAMAFIEEAYRAFWENFTVYLFERRNEMPEGYSIRDMARDTAAAMEALGLSKVNLFGASQGGSMAMMIAIEHPEMVERLALGSATARVTEARYEGVFKKWVDLARKGDAEGVYLSFGKLVYPEGMYQTYKSALTEAAKGVTEEDLRRFIVMSEGMRGFDAREELRRIACPVLALGSRDDQVLGGEASMEIASYLGDQCRLYMYEGYGHAAYDCAPDYKNRILQFLLN